MGESDDRDLIRYYPDRKAWILEADQNMALRPYDALGN
jgi:hypothetical protein